jgi:hypothetical protein
LISKADEYVPPSSFTSFMRRPCCAISLVLTVPPEVLQVLI